MSELEQVRAQIAIAGAKRQLGLAEQLFESDEWSRADPVFTQQDNVPRTVFASPASRIDDRSDGRDRTIFEDEHDLNKVRQAVRVVANSSVNAIGARMNLTNYVIGTGYQYEAVPRDNLPAHLVERAEQAAAITQMVIDAFDELNIFRGDLERELYDRTKVDGEQFTSLFPQADGTTIARQVEPEQICEPPREAQRDLENWLARGIESGAPRQSWSFGVHKDADDVQNVHGYHLLHDANPQNWAYYPARVKDLRTPVIHHIRQNVNRNTSRGISDFYCVIDEIVRTDKTRRNIGESASLAAAIAWIVQHAEGVTQSTVSKMTAGNRARDYQETTKYGSRRRDVQKYNPGTILNIGKQEYKDGPMVSGANNFIVVMQAALRMIGSRWNMPEFMISGDASNGNYASIRESGTPFVKFAQQEQQFFGRQFREILWKAVEIAHLAGWYRSVPLDGGPPLRSLVEISASPPEVEQRDPLAQVQIAQAKQALGYSNKTIFSSMGDDYDAELAQREDEPIRPDAVTANALQSAMESCETLDDAMQFVEQLQPRSR